MNPKQLMWFYISFMVVRFFAGYLPDGKFNVPTIFWYVDSLGIAALYVLAVVTMTGGAK